jgi:hypothetical protein
MIDLAVRQAGIYLHLAKHQTTHPVLTIIFFVSEIHLTPLQTEYLSRLLDAILCQARQLFVFEVNPDRYDDCEHDCEEAPTGIICNFG